VILLPTLYLDGPVVLLEEEDACKGVGERDLAEGQALVRPPEHLWGEAERSPDHESHVAAPGYAERVEPPRELLRREAFPPS
jgi:hypothetical protein